MHFKGAGRQSCVLKGSEIRWIPNPLKQDSLQETGDRPQKPGPGLSPDPASGSFRRAGNAAGDRRCEPSQAKIHLPWNSNVSHHVRHCKLLPVSV